MLQLSISQAQSQFTKLLNQSVIIFDKKSHQKKAVILPFEEYDRLIKQSVSKKNLENGIFNQFVGILDNNFNTDDTKYKELTK